MFLRTGVLLSIACCAIASAGVQDPLGWVTNAGGVIARDAQGRVVAVDLRASWATDSDLDSLASIPTLSRLDLSETRITDHGLRQLKGASAITDLNLRYAELITGEGLSSLKTWAQLKRLNMEGTKLTDNTLQHLSAFTSLESVNLGSVLVTDAGLDALTSLPHLRELILGGNKLTDAGLQALRQLPGLTYLDLGGTQREDSGLWSVSLTQPGLDAIATLKELRRLKLEGALVTARGLATLQVLSKLEELDLHDCPRIGDDVIPVLSAMPGLRSVDLAGTKVTGAGIAKLRKAKPNCLVRGGGAAAKSGAQIDEP